MSGIDPIDGLLALGVITREQLEQANHVDPDIASTIVGRLVAVGANAPDVLQGISSLAGIPLASPAMLDAPAPDVPPALAVALRDVPAAVIGKQPDGTLDVVVAEPAAVGALSSLKLPRHRVFLALEFHVRDAAERMVPDDAPAPAPRTATPMPMPAPPLPSRGAPSSEPPAIVLMPFQPAPAAPAPFPSSSMNDAPVGEVAAAGVKPVREKYAPNARPTGSPTTSGGTKVPDSLRAAAAPSNDPFAFMNAPSAASSGVDAKPLPKPAPLPKPSEKPRPPPTAPAAEAGAPKSKAPLVAAVVVIGLVAAGVALGPGLVAKLNPPPPDPAAQLAQAQQKELEAAQSDAAKGNTVEAIIHCEAVVKLDPTTTAAHKAVMIAAEQHLKNADPAPLEDLEKLAMSLPASSPDRAEAEATLARLKPKPIDVDTKPADDDKAKPDATKPDATKPDATKSSTAKPDKAKPAPDKQEKPAAKKAGDVDLDHDAAANNK